MTAENTQTLGEKTTVSNEQPADKNPIALSEAESKAVIADSPAEENLIPDQELEKIGGGHHSGSSPLSFV